MTEPKVGDIVTLKKVTNPYVLKNAELKVVKIGQSFLTVEYHNKKYFTHFDNVKIINKDKERVQFT